MKNKGINPTIKTVAFIDAANIIYSAKRELGFKVDLRKLVHYLKMRFNASKIFYYSGVNVKKIDYDTYDKMLYSFGLIPRLKLTKFYFQQPKTYTVFCKYCKKKNIISSHQKIRFKANCDVDLTLDILDSINVYKQFILLSGDGDFVPLIVRLQKLKKQVLVIASSKKTARAIKSLVADRFIEINNIRMIIEYKKRRRN